MKGRKDPSHGIGLHHVDPVHVNGVITLFIHGDDAIIDRDRIFADYDAGMLIKKGRDAEHREIPPLIFAQRFCSSQNAIAVRRELHNGNTLRHGTKRFYGKGKIIVFFLGIDRQSPGYLFDGIPGDEIPGQRRPQFRLGSPIIIRLGPVDHHTMVDISRRLCRLCQHAVILLILPGVKKNVEQHCFCAADLHEVEKIGPYLAGPGPSPGDPLKRFDRSIINQHDLDGAGGDFVRPEDL